MIHDAKTSTARGLWVNAETLETVRWVRWYNSVTHEYEAFRADPVAAKAGGVDLHVLLYRGRAKLNFVQTGVAPPLKKAAPSQDDPEVVRLLRTLPRAAKPDNVDHGIPLCDEPLCRRPAMFKVADETEIPPAVGDDGRSYERAVVPRFRRYCPQHYRVPTFTSLRGVTNETPVELARPQ